MTPSPTTLQTPDTIQNQNQDQDHDQDKKDTSPPLHKSIAHLESQTADMERQIANIKAKLKNDASETVTRHIRLLHQYNEIKDIGQGLMGLMAEARGVRQAEIQQEFGVGCRD
ncbi:hypothetical protein P175DRAFT_0553968 [Aspergillus ochraceoroseus IBT 24754]|uniref:Swi5-domain-containing protein n=1 Tax=Aspergillus ochraceoroseus IBT 24754 TaxID=1392256 RepID=A0A2T5M836_9EURO|nr:uncharacterized protein P175DRAFT_0553968 [Aspergillus ochraceoroseus IBT 24754]PTU24687.1 hypothetical protein P175DRAFT_0553968 [Aspergillus ochraceoroseus IBT 24754]